MDKISLNGVFNIDNENLNDYETNQSIDFKLNDNIDANNNEKIININNNNNNINHCSSIKDENNENNTVNDDFNEYETASDVHLHSIKKNYSLNSFDNNNETMEINNKNNHANILRLVHDYALMHTFLKEQNIYSDPKDYYKRRTIIIYKRNNMFGFDLQVRFLDILNNSQFNF